MVKKILIILFAMLFFLQIASAEQSSLGTFRQGDCINLLQTCSNCSYNNITQVSYPNSSYALSNVIMTKSGSTYNYTFCYTTTLGIYTVSGIGNPDSTDEVWIYDFEITPTGNSLTTSQGLMYLFIIIIMIGVFLLTVFGAIKIQFRNERNEYGDVIKINWKKYLKIFCVGISYVSLIWIIYLAWNLSYAYIQMRGLATFFRYLYTMLIGFSLPIFAVILIFGLIAYVNDKKINDYITKFSAEASSW